MPHLFDTLIRCVLLLDGSGAAAPEPSSSSTQRIRVSNRCGIVSLRAAGGCLVRHYPG